MAYHEITALLGGWEGFAIIRVQREVSARGSSEVVIELAPVASSARHCGRCGAPAEVHDTTVRRIRELPILDSETWLMVPVARVRCPRCGPSTEALPWLDRYAWMTKRFAESVARLASVLPIKQVAEHFGVSRATVSRYTALLIRLPADFVEWLEGCDDSDVLRNFTKSDKIFLAK